MSYMFLSLSQTLKQWTFLKCFASFQFLNPKSQYDSLDGGSASRKAAAYTGQHKHTMNADRHPCIEWDSNPQSQCSSEWRQFIPNKFVCVFYSHALDKIKVSKKKKPRGLSPQANYADRATAACRRSCCQLLRIEGVAWSAQLYQLLETNPKK
jgi:hypothetical protein